MEIRKIDTISNKNTQLWKEEPEKLLHYVSAVPDAGTIVEIGTADGGTSLLMHRHCAKRGIKIVTIDTAATQRAHRILKNTNVEMISACSWKYASKWRKSHTEKVDLLFIDGDHSFLGVCRDFLRWSVHLNPKGAVLFHDVDPEYRGGLAHYAVYLFTQTILRKKILARPVHEYRFLYGRLKKDTDLKLKLLDFIETLRQEAKKINNIAGSGGRALLKRLKSKARGITSSRACYCIERLMKDDWALLSESCRSKETLRRCHETLEMFEHAYGKSQYPWRFSGKGLGNHPSISKFIAAEQVKLWILRQALVALVDWTP
jgi:predicted O-methyltransferase YrrM